MNKFEKVKEFHQKMGLNAPQQNELLNEKARQRRYNLITEEATELLEGEDATNQLDAFLDLLYVVLGTGVEMGLSYEQVTEGFDEVHRSNMSKLDKDGKPTYREDGKLLKPDTYKKPDLVGIFKPLN